MLSPILACADVSQALDYYTQKLGFELAWCMPPNDAGKTEFACVKLCDAEILLASRKGSCRRKICRNEASASSVTW